MQVPAGKWSVVLLTISLCVAAPAAERPVDASKSMIRIHVGKAGLFSVAGHEHWVTAPIAQGSLDDSASSPRVNLTFDARELTVEPDKGLSAKDQAEVQKTMQQKVLESERYPEITFRSTSVKKTGRDTWSLNGILTLHGQSKPVTATVRRAQDKYVGHSRIRQTDFGIEPVSVGGGLVKVRNELDIEFSVAAQLSSSSI